MSSSDYQWGKPSLDWKNNQNKPERERENIGSGQIYYLKEHTDELRITNRPEDKQKTVVDSSRLLSQVK